jgi:DNA-binding response OmpR family regulator
MPVFGIQYFAAKGTLGNGARVLTGGEPYEGPARGPLRVLVVDDDRDTVLSVRLLLECEGYDVRSAFSANGALDAVREFEPHAVLLDIGMPGMSGYEVARLVRERHGEALVLIALTGWNKASDKLLAKLAGFDHHITKPYDPQAILALLSTLARGQAS